MSDWQGMYEAAFRDRKKYRETCNRLREHVTILQIEAEDLKAKLQTHLNDAAMRHVGIFNVGTAKTASSNDREALLTENRALIERVIELETKVIQMQTITIKAPDADSLRRVQTGIEHPTTDCGCFVCNNAHKFDKARDVKRCFSGIATDDCECGICQKVRDRYGVSDKTKEACAEKFDNRDSYEFNVDLVRKAQEQDDKQEDGKSSNFLGGLPG